MSKGEREGCPEQPVDLFQPRYDVTEVVGMFDDVIQAALDNPSNHLTVEQIRALRKKSEHKLTSIYIHHPLLSQKIKLDQQSSYSAEKSASIGKSPAQLVRETSNVVWHIATGNSPDTVSFGQRMLEIFDDNKARTTNILNLVGYAGGKATEDLYHRVGAYRKDLIPALAGSFAVAAEEGMDVAWSLSQVFNRTYYAFLGKTPDQHEIAKHEIFQLLHDKQSGNSVFYEDYHIPRNFDQYAIKCPYEGFATALQEQVQSVVDTIASKVKNDRSYSHFTGPYNGVKDDLRFQRSTDSLGLIAKNTVFGMYRRLKKEVTTP